MKVLGKISPKIKIINEISIIIEELLQPTSKKCNVANVVAAILETFVPNKIKNKKISFLLRIC